MEDGIYPRRDLPQDQSPLLRTATNDQENRLRGASQRHILNLMRLVEKLAPPISAAMTIFLPAVCWAQTVDVPDPTLRPQSAVWLGYAVMFGFAAAVIAVSLMPSKRSHQD